MTTTREPFAKALRDYLSEHGISQRELTRRTQKHGWGSISTVNFIVKGELNPSIKAMEMISKGLSIHPSYWAEYRLAKARNALDPAVVGLKAALRNLGE